jgi:hypothetical protein
VLPAIRAPFIAPVRPAAADWIRCKHAPRRGDGDGPDEQKDGSEAANCTELHGCHLLSHHLVPRKRRLVHMIELDLG